MTMIDYICKKINSIPKKYYKQYNPVFRDGYRIDYSQRVIYPERAYCAYLFHLFLSDQENRNQPGFSELIIDAEIYKRISGVYQSPINNAYEKTLKNIGMKIGCYPDLIIHGGQDSTENNLLALEVKTVSDLKQSEFNRDYFKVNAYAETLGYRNSFYIIINIQKSVIETYLKKYRTLNYFEHEGTKVSIVIKESFDSHIEMLV